MDLHPDRFHAACRAEGCGHVWVAAHLPMPLGRIAKLMKGLHCPKCGEGAKKIMMAEKAEVERLYADEAAKV